MKTPGTIPFTPVIGISVILSGLGVTGFSPIEQPVVAANSAGTSMLKLAVRSTATPSTAVFSKSTFRMDNNRENHPPFNLAQQPPTDVQRLGRRDPDLNRAILPSDFRVYVRQNTVVNHFYPGFEERILPTINDYTGYPGCYVAAYSREADNALYSVGDGIYVMGQVRVPGRYEGRICRPTGYERADISAAPEFKALLSEHLPEVCSDNRCWAGGDTGGWFGIQP